MGQAKVDTRAVRVAEQWARRAAEESEDDARAVGDLFARVSVAGQDPTVDAAARAAGASWGRSLTEAAMTLQAVATGLRMAASAYEETETRARCAMAAAGAAQ